MSKGMLGKLLLSDVQGPRDDLENKLAGDDGPEWLVAFGKFLRRENPWERTEVKPKAKQFWKRVSDAAIRVRVGASPSLPFDGATILYHAGKGWVLVEKRPDGLYVDGRKVMLFLSERQEKGQTIRGYELRYALTGKPVLNATLADALYENQHLVPEDWQGKVVYFWGTRFSGRGGDGCVRCLFFGVGAWRRDCRRLGGDWDSGGPAAVLAGPLV